jgi:AraC-like DNA-binding protein
MSSSRRLRTLVGQSALLQVEVGEAFGVSQADAAEVGLQAQALQSLEARASGEAVYAHLEQVAARGPVEPFVVELARRHGAAASLGLVGLLMKTCTTARQAMECFLRYQRLSNELAETDLAEQGSQGVLTEHRHGPESQGALVASEVWALSSVAMTRKLLEQELTPLVVDIRRTGVDTGPYEAFLRCEVRQGAPRTRIVFDAQWLEWPLPGADSELAAYLEQQARARLEAASEQPSVVLELRRVLREQLPRGTPSVAQVARSLALSTRSLQRRLSEAGTSYEQVLDELRADLARACLAREDLSVAEVGFLLGFQDSSSFHRACRRWFGTTPTALRAAQVAG